MKREREGERERGREGERERGREKERKREREGVIGCECEMSAAMKHTP